MSQQVSYKGRFVSSLTNHLISTPMVLFFIGMLEMAIISSWTKTVSEARVVASGVITMINIFIWYYVLQVVINDISNMWLIVSYAAGCAVGTMATTALFRLRDQRKQGTEKRRLFAPTVSKPALDASYED